MCTMKRESHLADTGLRMVNVRKVTSVPTFTQNQLQVLESVAWEARAVTELVVLVVEGPEVAGRMPEWAVVRGVKTALTTIEVSASWGRALSS